ncbi:O-antigen ligase family protein [Flagellimonas sp.]|uniref:O-antigen ligase family protein n=1 Tax=Flagellimonas sp. TaxID=2058762 RepID=UPI003BAE2EC5
MLLRSRLVLLYALFFLTQLVGLVYTENLQAGTRKTMVLLPFLVLPAIIVGEAKNVFVTKLYSALKFAVPLVFVVMALLYFISKDFHGLGSFVQLWFVNRLGISQFYLVFLLLLPIFFCAKDIENKNALLNTILVSSSSFFILLMNNFTGLLFLVVALALFLRNLFRNASKGYFLVIMPTVIVILLMVVLANPTIEKKFDPLITTSMEINEIKVKNKYGYTRNTFEHRLYIHYLAISDFKNNFPIGVGTGDTQEYLNQLYRKNNFLVGIKRELNAHSQYLQEYLKTGLLGFLSLSLLFFYMLKHCQSRNSIFFFYILFFAVACAMESYLNRYHGVIICSGIIPLLMIYGANKEIK